jgi:hypothetical protein
MDRGRSRKRYTRDNTIGDLQEFSAPIYYLAAKCLLIALLFVVSHPLKIEFYSSERWTGKSLEYDSCLQWIEKLTIGDTVFF